jgi:hypothetical protein
VTTLVKLFAADKSLFITMGARALPRSLAGTIGIADVHPDPLGADAAIPALVRGTMAGNDDLLQSVDLRPS